MKAYLEYLVVSLRPWVALGPAVFVLGLVHVMTHQGTFTIATQRLIADGLMLLRAIPRVTCRSCPWQILGSVRILIGLAISQTKPNNPLLALIRIYHAAASFYDSSVEFSIPGAPLLSLQTVYQRHMIP